MNSVNTPPSAVPNTAPTGAPAEKVANAKDRARDGGNACARMPSYIKSNEASRFWTITFGKKSRTDAGIVAAAPIP